MGPTDNYHNNNNNNNNNPRTVTSAVRASTGARNSALLDWYADHKRELPWRRSHDPYPVLVSEIMLQQTQVHRAIDRFERFMSRWPEVDDLAAASNDDVLAEWSGLGYNSRAVRLRDAARIVSNHGWPQTVSELTDLPGVGPYTAAAVAAIAFNQPVPAVDTNLKRVISRWQGSSLSGSTLQSAAEDELGSPAGDWNQALMDLGSGLCTPKNPRCDICPVSHWCADPSIYEPPPRQPTFAGSNRQLRGALVRAHLAGHDLQGSGRDLGRSNEEIQTTIENLREEGLIA
jgi:A/G-specific adenine glycosylase